MTGISTVLSLAAAPSVAVMALLTSVVGGGPDMLCSAGHAASALSGMAPMYLLMSAFHLGPWLKLVCRQALRADRVARNGACFLP